MMYIGLVSSSYNAANEMNLIKSE